MTHRRVRIRQLAILGVAWTCALVLTESTRNITSQATSAPITRISIAHVEDLYVSPQDVRGPHQSSINRLGGLVSLSDEHSSIFQPREIQGPDTTDYLFFVASMTNLNKGSDGTSGLVVLRATPDGPVDDIWTLDFATPYGAYASSASTATQFGQVFLSPMARTRCPITAKPPDNTFDLNYANAGSVVIDSTNPANSGPGNLLMIYDATNRCVGRTITTTEQQKTPGRVPFYGSIGVATSFDYGVTWPTYPMVDFINPPMLAFNLVYLPSQSHNFGPHAPFEIGRLGGSVCVGNNVVNASSINLLVRPECTAPTPPSDQGFAYGRYPVLAPPLSIGDADTLGEAFKKIANSEPSAFVDAPGAARTGGATYLYVVYDYVNGNDRGPASLGELMMAQAQLGASQQQALSFKKWVPSGGSGAFVGTPDGADGAVFPMQPPPSTETPPSQWPSYHNCQALGHQVQTMGSISYVDETDQYVLTFVCRSDDGEPGRPANTGTGHSLFYSILNVGTPLAQQQWSAPREIRGSWFVNLTVPDDYPANYPTFMSLNSNSGHISTSGGYIFGMSGCASGGCTGTGGRRYMSWKFSVQ
jgi:hypothetical protein